MSYDVILSLISLITLECLLGINNEMFISLLTEQLPAGKRKAARFYGIVISALTRLSFLFIISMFLKMEKDMFDVGDHTFTLKEVIFIVGGVFLIFASTREIFGIMENKTAEQNKKRTTASFVKVIIKIVFMTLIFSLESIITSIAVAEKEWVMYAGVITGVLVILIASNKISKFLKAHPSLKVLAFCFLFLIGLTLICDGFEIHIPKGFIYFVMLFSVLVDLIYMRINGKKINPS